MQVNQLRGLLYEFGVSFRTGRVAGLNEIRARMAELEDALPGIMIFSLQDQLRRIDAIERDIDQLEKQISGWLNRKRLAGRSPKYLASANSRRLR